MTLPPTNYLETIRLSVVVLFRLHNSLPGAVTRNWPERFPSVAHGHDAAAALICGVLTIYEVRTVSTGSRRSGPAS